MYICRCLFQGFMVPFIYLPNYAKQIGASEWEASFLVSIIGITNTLGKSIIASSSPSN